MRRTLLLILLACSACATRDVLVTSEPRGAFVQVDGSNVGHAPLRHVFDFSEKTTFTVSALSAGYLRAETTVTKESLDGRELHLVLMEDPSWRATTTTDATNAWLRVQVNADMGLDAAWQRIVDALTERYGALEQLDPISGYLRTAATVRRFRGPDGEFKIRTRLVGVVASRQPLVLKLKLECDRSERDGDWQAWTRPFKEDASLIEELQNRLGAGIGARRFVAPAVTAPAPAVTCQGCGEKLPANARFCPSCGRAQ